MTHQRLGASSNRSASSNCSAHHNRWHHPEIHRRRTGWSWECRCGAAGRSIVFARPWQAVVVEAMWHADHALG